MYQCFMILMFSHFKQLKFHSVKLIWTFYSAVSIRQIGRYGTAHFVQDIILLPGGYKNDYCIKTTYQ